MNWPRVVASVAVLGGSIAWPADTSLDEVRAYALAYAQELPDFVCVEQTRRYLASDAGQAWRLVDTLVAQLTFFNQKEEHKLLSQNGRAVKDASYESAGGLLSVGDFGTILRQIFDPKTQTTFTWQRYATLRGRKVQVFSYRVPLPVYRIAYQGEAKAPLQTTKVPYRGSVSVDSESHVILQITCETLNIEPSFPVRLVNETLEYDSVRIGDRKFVLPHAATLDMRIHVYRGMNTIRNEKEFLSYRKYSADTVIKFGGEEPSH